MEIKDLNILQKIIKDFIVKNDIKEFYVDIERYTLGSTEVRITVKV